MAREPLQTLTEPMYYILLCLTTECCGADIMRMVESVSHGRVRIGPGTLYALLQRFQESGVIADTCVRGRIRRYIITDYGRKLLDEEYARLEAMCRDRREFEGRITE